MVTGSRTEKRLSDSTAAIEVIAREDIEATGSETVAKVLETHPGVELEPSYRARHRGTARLDFRHAGSGFSASARSALVGHRPYYLPGPDGQVVTEVVDRAVTLGLRAALPVWKHIEAFLGVDNLLQAGHEDYLPIAPRTVYGGTNLRY